MPAMGKKKIRCEVWKQVRMRRIGLALLLFLIMASCRGPSGSVPVHHEAEYEAALMQQDIRDYSRLIERNPDHAEAYVHRAMVYVRQGNYDKAIEDFTKAIDIDPNVGSTYGKRGATRLALGEHEEAIRDFTKAIELYPRFAQAYCNRGNAYLREEDYTQALKDFTAAIEIHPGYAKAYYGRAKVYSLKRRPHLAAQDCRRACDLGEEDACRVSGR
jgi:tetratricopeptide (TPR) repeat protein